MRSRAHVGFAAALCVSLITAACGSWQAPLPTGPSGFGDAPSSGAIITGTVNGGSLKAKDFTPSATSTMTVRVVGTDVTAPVSVSGKFVLKGVPAGSLRLEFSTTATSATVQLSAVADGEQIDVSVNVNASAASVESIVRIKVDDDVEIEGNVEQVSGSCASLIVVVHGTAVAVDASVQNACSAIRVGVHIKIKGHRKSGTTVVVRVEINGQTVVDGGGKKHDDDDDDEDEDEGEHHGGHK